MLIRLMLFCLWRFAYIAGSSNDGSLTMSARLMDGSPNQHRVIGNLISMTVDICTPPLPCGLERGNHTSQG